MKGFLLRLSLFFILSLVSVEAYIRVNHLTIDIPERMINKEGIQAYIPNQTGYWINGSHKWKINSEGWPGNLPESMDNLITLIGDSHIENFMNPEDCHLGSLLNSYNLNYNYFEAGRSGATFIEYLQIAKFLQSKYKPKSQFIFVKESDFSESLVQARRRPDVTQLDIENGNIINGTLKNPTLKKILYNIKTLYFFRSTFTQVGPRLDFGKNNRGVTEKEDRTLEDAQSLMEFIQINYDTENLVFYLHPETRVEIVSLFENYKFKYYKFDAKNNLKWRNSSLDQAHWSCYGFQQAAKQIINIIQ